MTIAEIYNEYEMLNKPYQEGTTKTPEELHNEVMRHIDRIGNANPHWVRLNEIESNLRNWVF